MDFSTSGSLRHVLQRYPTGVTVVTSLYGGFPAGGTMNSFVSVSLNPELVSVSIVSAAKTAAAISETGKFNVNLLAADQTEVAIRFSSGDPEGRFEGGKYKAGRNGLPVLDGAFGVIECDLFKKVELADHTMFVGKVTDSYIVNGGPPLVYYGRNFLSLQLQ